MNTILNTLPRIIVCDDYHEIHYLPDDIKRQLGIKIKVKELGFDGNYIGLVYQGKLPSKQAIANLLEKERIQLVKD